MSSDIILEDDQVVIEGRLVGKDGQPLSCDSIGAAKIDAFAMSAFGLNAATATVATQLTCEGTIHCGVLEGSPKLKVKGDLDIEGAAVAQQLEVPGAAKLLPNQASLFSAGAVVLCKGSDFSVTSSGSIVMDCSRGEPGTFHRFAVRPTGVELGGPKGVTISGPVTAPGLQVSRLSGPNNALVSVSNNEATVAAGSSTLTVGTGRDVTVNTPGRIVLDSFPGPGVLHRIDVGPDGVVIGGQKGVKLLGPVEVPGLQVSKLTGRNTSVDVSGEGAVVASGESVLTVGSGEDVTVTTPGRIVLDRISGPNTLHRVDIGPDGVEVGGPNGVKLRGPIEATGTLNVTGPANENLFMGDGKVSFQAPNGVNVMVPAGPFIGIEGDAITLLGPAGKARLDTPSGLQMTGPAIELLGAGATGKATVQAAAGLEIVGPGGEDIDIQAGSITVQAPASVNVMVPGGSFVGIEAQKITLLGPNGKATVSVPQGLQIEAPGGVVIDLIAFLDQVGALQQQVRDLETRLKTLESRAEPVS